MAEKDRAESVSNDRAIEVLATILFSLDRGHEAEVLPWGARPHSFKRQFRAEAMSLVKALAGAGLQITDQDEAERLRQVAIDGGLCRCVWDLVEVEHGDGLVDEIVEPNPECPVHLLEASGG